MENDEADKITEALFRANSHKTTQQTLELLESNKYFQKDIADLRVIWVDLIEGFRIRHDETTEKLKEKVTSKANLPEKVEKVEKLEDAFPIMFDLFKEIKDLPEDDKKELALLQTNAIMVLANRDFTNDIIEVCKKYKLSPVEIWLSQIRTYVALGHLLPPDFFLLAGLKDYLTREEIINSPQNLNFIPSIKTNPTTGEKTLSIDFLDNATIKQDLKKHGGIIEKIQKLLRREKGVKRFYPIKNMEDIKELAKLDKQKITYFEPLSGKEITTKMNYVDKALKINSDLPLDRDEEEKAGNRLKQTNHRNKKRFL